MIQMVTAYLTARTIARTLTIPIRQIMTQMATVMPVMPFQMIRRKGPIPMEMGLATMRTTAQTVTTPVRQTLIKMVLVMPVMTSPMIRRNGSTPMEIGCRMNGS